MIIPTKHQNLSDNALVLGADILHLLRKENLPVENVIKEIKEIHSVKTDFILDAIVFLWILGALKMETNLLIRIKD